MSRHRRSYFLALLVLVAAVSALALTRGSGIARIPEDLVPCASDSPWLLFRDTYALTDGSGRSLRQEGDGDLALIRSWQEVPTPFQGTPASSLLGVSPDFRALLCQPKLPAGRPNTGVVTLVGVGVGEHPAPVTSQGMRLPESVQWLQSAVLSPDGTTLAWHFVCAYERPGVPFLRRLAPALAERFPPHRMDEVWVSSAQGGSLRRLATVPQEGAQWHASGAEALSVGWSQKTGKLAILFYDKPYRLR